MAAGYNPLKIAYTHQSKKTKRQFQSVCDENIVLFDTRKAISNNCDRVSAETLCKYDNINYITAKTEDGMWTRGERNLFGWGEQVLLNWNAFMLNPLFKEWTWPSTLLYSIVKK